MPIRSLYLRTGTYLRRHGLKSSIKRVWPEVRNRILRSRNVIYGLDLYWREFEEHAVPANCQIEKADTRAEMPEGLLKQIAEYYNEELLLDAIRKRYEMGARLWYLRSDAGYVGYTWSLTGRAMAPYFFPMMERDVFFFDVFVFPPYRGRGFNSVLMNHLLRHYKNDGFLRAYVDTLEWNSPEMRSLAKNGFVRIGLARKRFRRGKCKVTWWY